MERLSSHVSTAKATFSGRSASQAQDGAFAQHTACRQHIKGLQKALRNRLQPESPAATTQLCSYGNGPARMDRRLRANSIHAAIAEPPLEVLEETFPRGASWEVIAQCRHLRNADGSP